ncbi:MAG: hypothetical protein LN561_06745 [Rickettsia endosymbiont of Labidopullus appendiculatus]|nr:hypothetical protein [Rickettsia endosymbiont of Labidopullus appendiculatus]
MSTFLNILGDYIARFELILDKIDNLSFQQEALNTIDFLAQQKVSLSPKIIYYVEQCLDNTALQITAFKVLKNQADQGVYRLSTKCLDILDKLAERVGFKHLEFLKDTQDVATNHEYLSIFTALLDIKYINNEVLSKLPSYNYWVRELLSYDLVMRTGATDSYDLETFDVNLIELEKKHNYDLTSKDRDKLLLSLINLQQENNYNLKQINQILELLIDLPTDILSKLDKTKDSIRGKINNVINNSSTANVIDRSVLIDTMLGTNKFTANIMKEMSLILRPEESAFINAASAIIKAIADQYNSGITTCISLVEKAATVTKILNVTDRFCHKLISKLSEISNELPSNQELFNIYMQYYLSSDDSIAIYNTLINEKILSNEGKVIGEDLSKINDLNFGQNNKLKSIILSFCVKLKDLQAADNKEVREKVASNVENMITNRIMHLIKAEILSPAINSGISELSNAMTNKLRQASQAAKAGVKHEMSKHYNRVVLTTDGTYKENQLPKTHFSQSSSQESFDRTKKTDLAASKSTPLPFVKQGGHNHSVLFPHTEGSSYLDSLSNQMSRPNNWFSI